MVDSRGSEITDQACFNCPYVTRIEQGRGNAGENENLMAGEHTEIAGVDGRGYVCRSPQCSRKSSSEGTSEQQGDALAESAIGFAGNYGTSRGIPEFPFFKYLYYQQREFV